MHARNAIAHRRYFSGGYYHGVMKQISEFLSRTITGPECSAPAGPQLGATTGERPSSGAEGVEDSEVS